MFFFFCEKKLEMISYNIRRSTSASTDWEVAVYSCLIEIYEKTFSVKFDISS